jgi:6-phospho 3-hexuloisomerase
VTINRISKDILKKLDSILEKVDPAQAKSFMNKIQKSDRVFIVGMGRSGLAGRAFAMRLMHCGKKVFVVGECTTPAIQDGDVLVAISGSGQTSSVVSIAVAAKKHHATLLVITSNTESDLAKMADAVVSVQGRTKLDEQPADYEERQIGGERIESTPMGTLFELSAMIFLDSVIALLMKEERIDEGYMKRKHTNLE